MSQRCDCVTLLGYCCRVYTEPHLSQCKPKKVLGLLVFIHLECQVVAQTGSSVTPPLQLTGHHQGLSFCTNRMVWHQKNDPQKKTQEHIWNSCLKESYRGCTVSVFLNLSCAMSWNLEVCKAWLGGQLQIILIVEQPLLLLKGRHKKETGETPQVCKDHFLYQKCRTRSEESLNPARPSILYWVYFFFLWLYKFL